MSLLVKICGITNAEDALWAANLGADFIGLNFSPLSPRKVSVDMAAGIAAGLPPFVKCVGIFTDPPQEDVEKVLKKVPLAAVQFHGNEKREDLENVKARFRVQIWKAVRVKDEESLKAMEDFIGAADKILLDAWVEGQAGGTGKTLDWTLARKARMMGIPIILAGGLTPDNVKEAVDSTDADGVDAASGVEKDGHPRRKDIEKMKLFISRARS
ncbi:MAG: hypothetical protein A3A86_00480 [Elusimicrobia bacterium RIFCSPLOWO2_01_FULL_60_11]|nr:MAG: hypothetical protein A3A86_00480 [Elusimicrobia bacterium RIFCSPLOWO2_01_FULL_60_11]